MKFLEVGNVVVEVIEDLVLFVVYGYGSYLVLKKTIDIAEVFLYQSFLVYFLNSVKALIKEIDQYYNYRVSLERVEDIYTIGSENFVGSYYYYGYQLNGDIVFNNLTYKYGIKKILDGLTMTIKSGEKILLIGESGSGKSSLVKILMRYLDVPYGMCSINNIDINHYHLENIRKNISYVSSDEFLFTDTLYNNITLEKDVEEEEFLKVCHITRVDEIIKKRGNDYHIMVEENGFNFSNGERQRIILARYLIRKSNIYIFDEALGQLDTSKEKEILKDMFNYLKEKTVIVISHRTNNSRLFTKTLKLEDGHIYETKV